MKKRKCKKKRVNKRKTKIIMGGKDFDSVIEDIVDVAELHNVPLSSSIVDIVADLSRWEFCKGRVFPVLISTKRNQEMLISLISKELLDLSIIYVVRLDSVDESIGTVKVSCDLMKTWGVSLEELHAKRFWVLL